MTLPENFREYWNQRKSTPVWNAQSEETRHMRTWYAGASWANGKSVHCQHDQTLNRVGDSMGELTLARATAIEWLASKERDKLIECDGAYQEECIFEAGYFAGEKAAVRSHGMWAEHWKKAYQRLMTENFGLKAELEELKNRFTRGAST